MNGHLKTFVIGAVAGALFGAAPAVAGSVVRFARNADKVDGFHAVGARQSAEDRAGKLVATNMNGRLPNDVIRTAPDAARLDGREPEEYARTCVAGGVTGLAFVDVGIGSDLQVVAGHNFVNAHIPPVIEGANPQCQRGPDPRARRISAGLYEVSFGSTPGSGCDASTRVASVVTPKDPLRVLAATAQTVCKEDGSLVEQVRISDLNGVPSDAAFTLAVFTEREIFLP